MIMTERSKLELNFTVYQSISDVVCQTGTGTVYPTERGCRFLTVFVISEQTSHISPQITVPALKSDSEVLFSICSLINYLHMI